MLFEIKTYKLEMSGIECGWHACKRLPEYHWHMIGQVYHIKQDTICATICVDGFTITVPIVIVEKQLKILVGIKI
jgi:hypothetical protein